MARAPDESIQMLRHAPVDRGQAEAFGPIRDAEFQVRRQRRMTIVDYLAALIPPLDGAYGFGLFLAMLFVQQLGSAAGAAICVLPIGYIFLRRRSFTQTLLNAWPVFAFGVFVLLSALWSEDMGASLRYGAEYVVTILAAIALAGARKPHAMLKGALMAFLVYGVGSLTFGKFVGIGMGGSGMAFVGLGEGKNMMADIASIGLLTAMAVLFISLRQRSAVWLVAALAGITLEGFLTFMARSAGATLGVAGALVVMLGVVCACAASRTLRTTLLTLLAISGAIFAAVFADVANGLLSIGLNLFDKDPTLTGRTYLWYRANDLISEKPMLGRGFAAFWRQGNPDAEGLWQYAGIVSRSGFNFHNTPTEILVEIGYVGLALFGVVMLIGLLGLIRQYLNRPNLMLCFWFSLAAYFLIRAPFEAMGLNAFYYSTALMFAAAAYAMQPAPAAAVSRAWAAAPIMRRRAQARGRAYSAAS